MSDPLRDAMASKRSNRRETIRNEYTPIVLWVKTPGDIYSVRSWAQKELDDLPNVNVATKTEPYQFASDGVTREEDADGEG